jgi:hypothetical protein
MCRIFFEPGSPRILTNHRKINILGFVELQQIKKYIVCNEIVKKNITYNKQCSLIEISTSRPTRRRF